MPREWGMSPLSSLAGLSCINLAEIINQMWKTLEQFPSPRGVELHKPRTARRGYPVISKFPSPRGVELHKPLLVRFDMEVHVDKFPSPRGVELHKLEGTHMIP